MRHGTIWFVVPTCKPRKSRTHIEPKVDEDGIWDWFFEEDDEKANRLTDWGKTLWHLSLTTSRNTKRIVRRLVEARLKELARSFTSMQLQLDRIEEKLDALSRRK